MNWRFASRRSSSLAGGSGRLVELASQHPPTHGQVDNKPSFTERIKALEAAAETS
jgi:hypothetical protein